MFYYVDVLNYISAIIDLNFPLDYTIFVMNIIFSSYLFLLKIFFLAENK